MHLLMERERGSSPNVEMQLLRWAAGEWLQAPMRSSAYCKLNPEAKSTIALAFSSDGVLFASTHGDHTVKVFLCATWGLVCTLKGHRRTPWSIKFHPRDRKVLASGSLDESVRIWDLDTEKCVRVLNFDFVVSCIAFHSTGELLAVTSGRKIWLCRWQTQRAPHTVLPLDGQPSPPASLAPPRPTILERLGAGLVSIVSSAGGGVSSAPSGLSTPRGAGGGGGGGEGGGGSGGGDGGMSGPDIESSGADAGGANAGGANAGGAAAAAVPAAAAAVTPGESAGAGMPPRPGGGGSPEDEAATKVVILNGANPQRCVAFKRSATHELFFVAETNPEPPPEPPPQPTLYQPHQAPPFTVQLSMWTLPLDRSADLMSMHLDEQRPALNVARSVMYSDAGFDVSRCGRYLALCELDPQVGYHLRTFSLQRRSMGVALQTVALPNCPFVTSVQFAPLPFAVLIGYGRCQAPALAQAPQYAVLRCIEFQPKPGGARQLTEEVELFAVDSTDESNVALFHPHPHACAELGFLYATKDGRIRAFKFDRTGMQLGGAGSS